MISQSYVFHYIDLYLDKYYAIKLLDNRLLFLRHVKDTLIYVLILYVRFNYTTYSNNGNQQNSGETFNLNGIPKILSIFQNLAKKY